MQLDNLNIEFYPDSEYQDDERPDLYHISAHNRENMKRCPCGGFLKKKEAPGRKIHDYRPSPVTGEKHVYIVELHSQRYFCTNKNCGRSFTAGLLPRNFTHTDNFKEYVIHTMLTKENYSFSQLGKDVRLSHTTISNIFKNYAKNLNLHFIPHRNLQYMYLHEFSYQNEKRYYLVKVTHKFEANLVAFFGYKDCDEEMMDYFRFHWKEQEDSNHFLTLYTENGEHLQEMLKPYVKFI